VLPDDGDHVAMTAITLRFSWYPRKTMYRTVLIGILVFAWMAAAQQPQMPPRPTLTRPGEPTPEPPKLSDEEVMARATKVAQATIRWDDSSTPGMKAEIELLKKREAEGRLLVQYRIKVSGAPHNQPFTLMAWPVTRNDPAAVMDGLAVAQDGTVGCPANSTGSCARRFKGAELLLDYEATKGEIFRHALISADQKARIFFSIVPAPILASDQGCSLEVVRLDPNFELVLVRGKGFQPGEDLRFHEQSFQEVHDLPVKVDAKGEFQAQLTPAIKGRVGGTSNVAAAGKSCLPTISFDWGQL
jgi:hypothetical protein